MGSNARLAVDVGGTFTDVVALKPDTGELIFDKVPTTPSAPTEGVLAAFEKAQAGLDAIATFTHGTTLGLNALLTRRGARIAVIATHGFRDVYLLGRTDRNVMYDIAYRKPEPLLERHDTFEVRGRMLFDGSEHAPFDEQGAREIARVIAERGYGAVAVAFLHSYANPAHELAMRDVLAEEAPDAVVTLSHELSREYREYERTSTAVLDAYIKPIVRNYLEVLEGELKAGAFGGEFLMTRSGGGAMTADTAKEQPVSLILSGPAGGVIGASMFSALVNEPNLITIDMGGTSLDASLVVDGEPVLYQGAEFEGLPINTPSLYIHTIGAGGGSIAWVDTGGGLQVGPQSAGADPGPASYGLGGTEPTFTDAALAIGYLGADSPLGGKLTLDDGKALAALAPIAEKLRLEPRELASGIVRISATKIMGAVRAITVELGRDPKDFALLSFGGGGGLVAVDVARELRIPRVIVPPGQGAFSAFGMLMADVQHDYSRTQISQLAHLDVRDVEDHYHAMEDEGHQALADEGFAADRRKTQRSLDVRYVGQEHSVTVDFDADEPDPLAGVEKRFTELHKRQYGHAMTDPVEVVTLRVRATGLVDKPELPVLEQAGGPAEAVGVRDVYLSGGRVEPYQLYVRENLLAGHSIAGPAVIHEHTATTVIHAGDELRVGAYGEMVITLKEESDE